MFRKTILGLTAAATVGGMIPAAASAQPYQHGRHYSQSRYYDQGRYQQVRYGQRYNAGRNYYRGGQRCYDQGNGGLAIGGIAGGLLGSSIAGRGDQTLGAVLGAAVGALAGRAIDKSDGRPC